MQAALNHEVQPDVSVNSEHSVFSFHSWNRLLVYSRGRLLLVLQRSSGIMRQVSSLTEDCGVVARYPIGNWVWVSLE